MTTIARLTPNDRIPFPDISTNDLSPIQIQVIDIARTEYQKNPISYDKNVLKYTQNTKEAWCADFISWVMQQSGNSYKNPNSGSWRIPGVYTLQEYYKNQGRYFEVGSYKPHPGDVAFYIGKNALGLFGSSHAALVVQVKGNEITTIGGNENGQLRLDTQLITAGLNNLIGFGKL